MTWERGDLALCTDRRPWDVNFGPDSGYVGEVLKMITDGVGDLGLKFADWPEEYWLSTVFVKVPPLTTDERDEFLIDLSFDAEVAERLLKYGKVVR